MTGTTGRFHDDGAVTARPGRRAGIVVAAVLAGAMAVLGAAVPGEPDGRRVAPDRTATASGDEPADGAVHATVGVCGNCV